MESPLRDWLALQCQGITGAEAALAVLGASRHAPDASVAHWPAAAPPGARLAATVEAARARGQLAVQRPEDPGRSATHLALPVLRSGAVIGAVGFSVRGVPPAEIKALAERLAWTVRSLELLVDALGEQTRLGDLLSLAGGLLDHERLAEASHALASEIARRLGCERVAVGLLRRGAMQVLAMSTSLRFAEESDAVGSLRDAMEEASEQDAVIERPAPAAALPEPYAARAHETLLLRSGAGAVCTVPLSARGDGVGALVCEWTEPGALDDARRARVRDAARLAGPLLALQRQAEAGVRERLRTSGGAFLDGHFGADRMLAKVALAAVGALLLFVALAPAPYRIAARASLEGRIQRALVAAVDGYLFETNVRAGDVVAAGEVLARLDDRDLRLEQRRWASQKAGLEKEYREALAGQDRTQVSILRAQIEQAAAQLELAQEQLGRTNVVAPFDGVVVKGDLDRALGSPIERGSVLFELAPLDGYRIIVEVEGQDIADVAAGQTGRLALAALPDRALSLVVERIAPISTTEDGRSYFRVEAVLEEPSEALRPGMEGIAKIDAGQRRLLWIWTHGLFDWLRLRAWSFLP